MRRMVWLAVLVLCLVGQGVWAHFLWINPRAYRLDPGESLRLTLGFGHHFPGAGGDFLPEERLEEAFALDPQGRRVPVRTGPYPVLFETPSVLQEEGTYLLVAVKRAGFFSRTASGFARKPRSELQDVIECKFSRRYAKALVTVGRPRGESYRQVLGHELEIVPLADPARMRVGDELPVRVLFRGEPLGRTLVLATYQGFSPSGPGETCFSLAVRTDARGEARLPLDHRGVWLVMVSHREPYPRPEVCDVSTAVATLTFELR